MRLGILLALIVSLAWAVGTSADITGTNARVQLAESGTARWVQVVADPANSSAVRVGDYAVSATRGVRVAPGGGFLFPPQAQPYELRYIYLYIATDDRVSVVWGN